MRGPDADDGPAEEPTRPEGSSRPNGRPSTRLHPPSRGFPVIPSADRKRNDPPLRLPTRRRALAREAHMLSETPSTRASLGLLDRELRRRDFLNSAPSPPRRWVCPSRWRSSSRRPRSWARSRRSSGCTSRSAPAAPSRCCAPTTRRSTSSILDMISLDYHETLMVAAGQQAEASRHAAMEANGGKYVLIVEGAIPTKDGGIYCKIGGQTAIDMVKETRREGRRRSSPSAPAPPGAAFPPPTRTRPAPWARTRSSRARRSSRSPAARPTPTTCSAPSCSSRPSARCPRSTSSTGRSSPTAGRSTSTASAAPTSTPAASPWSSATRVTARATASTSSAARAPQTHANCSRSTTSTSRRRLADRHRPPLRRLHRAGARLPRPDPRHRADRPADAARHLPGDQRRAG